MQNQIKIICADMMNIEQRRDNAKKKSDKLIASTIAMTARTTIPDNKEMEDLQLSLMDEEKIIKETLLKLKELQELGMKVGMKQMVMNLGGENE